MNKKVIGIITLLSILTLGVEFKTNTYVKAEEKTISIMSNSDFEINDGVLEKYTGNKANVIIPDTVFSIGYGAFSGCSSLESITIPNSVISIKNEAFSGCSSLESITIPNSVISIENEAFSGCSSLEDITIPDSVTFIGHSAFNETKWLQNQKELNDFIIINNILIDVNKDKLDNNIIIPDTVSFIGNEAFYGCNELKSIIIPDSVISIGDYAFEFCNKLENIIIPNSVISIGDWTFSGCSSLENITIPDSVTSIGYSAFYETKWLKNQKELNDFIIINNILIDINEDKLDNNITIPDGVISIGNYVFSHYSNLESIILPNSMTSIGDWTFSDCSSLKNITIPDSVTSIGDCAFFDCSSLKNITIPDSVTSIGDFAFDNCSKLTIKGYSGSYTETYANDYNIPFTAIDVKKITLKTPTLKSLKVVTGKKLKLTINQIKDADGYEVVYATNKNFKNNKTKIMANKKTFILSELNNGKYYVKIRAYKNSSKEKIYSKYSKVLSANVK